MKKIMMLLTMGATVALLALPVAAKNLVVNATQDACSQEARDVLYKTFTDHRTTDQAKAYDAAKKYLACPVATPNESQTKIIEYLTRWVGLYEKAKRRQTFTDQLYNKKNYAEAFKLGGEILNDQSDTGDKTKILLDLGANGYLVASLNNPELTSKAIEYARQALEALNSGKTVEDWTGLQNKDVATAYTNYTIGSLTIERDPAGALKYLIKSAQFETELKKSPVTYALIAGAYETGPYAKQSQEYKDKFSGKDETPESKLALANIHQLVDRMIDGYARAVALAGSNSQKGIWTESLKQWYKFRNPDAPENASDEVVAGILSKPLPPEPTPLTSLPPTPAATTGGTSGTTTPANGTSTGTGNGTGNGTAAPAKPAATPAATPGAANTKPAAPKTGGPNKPRR